MHIAVIPARSGSKGVANKNLLRFRGQSLISKAANCARETGLFSQVILSTDSDVYAAEGIKSDCLVPFLRPADLASDQANIADVLIDLLQRQDPSQDWETLTLLEPTCPLRTSIMVSQCMRLCADDATVDASLTLSRISRKYHSAKQFVRDASGRVDFAHPEGGSVVNRQELDDRYIRNGAAYTIRCSSLRNTGRLLQGVIRSLVIEDYLINIDTPADIADLRLHGEVGLV